MFHFTARRTIALLIAGTFMFIAACGGPSQGQSTQPSDPYAQAGPASQFAQGTAQAPTGQQQQVGQEKPEGTLVVGLRAEIATLDQGAGSIPEITVGENIFETLVYRDFDGSVRPHLAERWEISPDGLNYTFFLRKGVKFHNGEPFNAETVKFSVEYIMDPETFTQFKSYWTDVDKIEPLDEHTVLFRLKRPNPLLLPLTPWHLPILPPKYVNENRKTWGRKPVGTGPYKFVEWIPNERIVMEANLDHWQGPPPFEKVVFRPIPDETARTAALLSGEVHVVGPLNLDQAPMIDQAPGVHVVWTDSLSRERLAMRNDVKPFDDIRVRQAVHHAIDRQAIIKSILAGQANPIYGPLVNLEWGFSPDLKDPYPYDPARAKELLAQAGHPNGFETEFEYSPGILPKNDETAEAIVNYLAAVGIKANLKAIDYAKQTEKARKREQVALNTTFWTGGGNFHGWQPFTILLSCDKASALWSPKPGYWCNREVDKLIEAGGQALHEKDEAKAKQLYAQAQKLAAEHAYQVWLWQFKEPWGVSDKVQFKPKGNNDIIMSWHQASWKK